MEYDELEVLENRLSSHSFLKCSLLEWLRIMVTAAYARRLWKPSEVMDELCNCGNSARDDLDNAFWWLVVEGMFAFTNIRSWFEGKAEANATYEDALANVRVSERGQALLDSLTES